MNALLAVHISDGLLARPWWLGGLALMAALMAMGAWRVRDEEIPRIAVLTSAFFIASLIHVRVGPTSVHLLLNGLIGVVLGWRAAVAIPVAVFLQAVLFGHGGFTAIGINSCIMIVPALMAGHLFRLLQTMPWIRRPWFRSGLVACSCLAFIGSLIFGVCLLWAAPGSTSASADASLIRTALENAGGIIRHPVTLPLAVLVSLVAALAERKLENAPEFPLGLLVGEVTVLATVGLNCLVLLVGGESNWAIPASLQVIAHLPIAVVEGLVLGFAVGLLARVRPDILGIDAGAHYPADGGQRAELDEKSPQRGPGSKAICNLQSAICNKHLLAALLILVIPAGPAWAHRLKGEYKVLPGQKVRVEGWFDLTAASAAGAIVQAIRENGTILAEGKLDEKGTFSFAFVGPEPLRIVISAGAGHREVLRVSPDELQAGISAGVRRDAKDPAEPDSADRSPSVGRLVLKAITGIGAVTAIAIFALAWRRQQSS